jgi:hypothetical protein
MKKKYILYIFIIIITILTLFAIFSFHFDRKEMKNINFDFLNNNPEKITINKTEGLIKITNVREFPDTKIYKNEKIKKFKGKYPLPIMIPKLNNQNIKMLCNKELKEIIYEGREYIQEEEYWMIKCNYF